MTISLTQVLIWIIIAAIVGVIGELIARRRAPDGIVGAIVVGLLAIFLIVGIFHFQIPGEPKLGGVPLISSIIVAAILVAIWSAFVYHRVRPYYSRTYRREGSRTNRREGSRTYRRGGYVRRPRRRLF